MKVRGVDWVCACQYLKYINIHKVCGEITYAMPVCNKLV